MNKNYTLKDLPEVANELIKLASNKVLLFYAEMGAGKTTLIKEICKQLGVTDVVSSPTFSLVNEYVSNSGETIYHFDFYRITDEEEALDIGIDDYFDSGNWCFIEWPNNIENLLPLDAVEIHISILENNQRNLELK
ncbi:MAG: tRNA (adenosine(37)-N6)-threonylcarbamoyltransferase complex ATPase subunit type 1 TsaE [Flavobacteriaceae bacterium]|nr:tRNA (adenosine(37)-N6)-threonylcarbamoyltransferase complex ATPase subunit type 1 TsaE [Flavobacteriaceae bacterium]